MAHLITSILGDAEISNFGLWFFLSVGAISLFAIFIPLVTWIDRRGKEREAFYKAEMMRRIAESSSEGAKAAIDLLRAEARHEQFKKIEGLKIGGLINVGVGISLIFFLRSLLGGSSGSPYLSGLIPGMVGVAMLVYVYVMAHPAE